MLYIQAWEGVGVVASARKLIGSTNPLQAEPGTIRGDLAVQTGRFVLLCINLLSQTSLQSPLQSDCQLMVLIVFSTCVL